MAVAKASDKERNNQPLMGAAKARQRTMEWVDNATTNHLWERQAAAGNESKRTVAGNGRQKCAAAANNRVDNCTTTAGTIKNGQQQ